jgi:putative hydrolase of the HAD superfamily
MKYEAIIFDLGGVIIDLDYQLTISAFKDLGMIDFDSSYSQAQQGKLFDNFETGQISAQHFINCLLPFLKPGTSPNKVVNAWNAMILSVQSSKIDLLLALREKYPLFLLSNTNELHVPKVRREWSKVTAKPMEDFFDHIYFSHEIHLRKPNSEIFQLVCDQQLLIPEKTLFIDDSLQHIIGAKMIGLQTLHLTDSTELNQLFS